MTTTYSIECWIIGPDRHVLLLRVPARPGEREAFWQPVTGGIAAGESPSQAALREITEETGLQLAESDLTLITADHIVEISPELTISKTLYSARAQQTTVMTNPHEHRDHQWSPPTKVTDLLFWHSNRDTWKLIDDYHQLTR